MVLKIFFALKMATSRFKNLIKNNNNSNIKFHKGLTKLKGR